MLTTTSIAEYQNHLHQMGHSPETVRSYGTDLTGFRLWLDKTDTEIAAMSWRELETSAGAYLTQMRTTWAAKTVLRRLGTLRSWATWTNGGPTSFLASYRPPRPAASAPHPIPEGIDGVIAMIKSTRNPQHRALCALTGLMGLRVNEAISVTPAHFDLADMTLAVIGKGDKTRVIPVSDTAWAWISKQYSRTSPRDRLVPLTNRGARAAITRHARNAGIAGRVSSHDMRATFATAAYDKTKDLRAVQELLGHANPQTTMVYTRVSERAMRQAAEVA